MGSNSTHFKQLEFDGFKPAFNDGEFGTINKRIDPTYYKKYSLQMS